jgi:hypothetical protein
MTILFDLIFFKGITFQSPITDSDFGPMPIRGLSTLINFFQVYSSKSIGGQVGTGSVNSLGPSYIIQYLYYYLSGNSTISQLSFLIAVSLSASLGMMEFIAYFIGKNKFYGFVGGLIYAFTPIFIINQMGQGNPGGFWFYMIIPWYLLSSFKVIDKPTKGNYIILALVTFFVGFLGNQTFLLIFIFFSIPFFLVNILISNGKRFSSFMYLMFTILGIYLLLIFSYIPITSNVNSDATAMTQISTILPYIRSLPSLYDLYFLNFPNFGNSLLGSPPFFLGPVNSSLLYVDCFIDSVLLIGLLLSKKIISRQFSYSMIAIFIFPFLILSVLISPIGIGILRRFPYLYAIFPEYFEIPLAFVTTCTLVIYVKISRDFLKYKFSGEEKSENNSKKQAKISFLNFEDHGKKLKLSLETPKYIVGLIVIVLITVSLSPIVISDLDSGGFVNVSNKVMDDSTYVPKSIIEAGMELKLLREKFNLQNARDLWDPVDSGNLGIIGIQSVDPNSLIFPAENVLSFNNSSNFKRSFAFLYNTQEYLVDGRDFSFANDLQQLGVAFVVVIKNYSTYNPDFKNYNLYNGTPIVDSGRNIIYANPLKFISILNKHKNLTEIENNSQFAIFMNNKYMGQIFGYNYALSPVTPLSSSELIWLDGLPIWKGSLPVTSYDFNATPVNNIVNLQFNNNSYVGKTPDMQMMSPSYLAGDLTNSTGLQSAGSSYLSMQGIMADNLANESESQLVSNYSSFDGKSLSFSGNTYLELDTKTTDRIENSIESSNKFTVNLWFNASSFANESNGIYAYTMLFGNGNSRGINIGEISSPNYNIFSVIYHNSQAPALYRNINTNRWYMVTLVYNGTVMSMYLNGNLTGNSNASIPTFNYATTFYIGGGPDEGWGNNFRGSLSDILLTDEALNVSQISDIYSSGPYCYNFSEPHSLLFLPLIKGTVKLPTVNLELPGNTNQVTIGYSGNISLNFENQSFNLKSNGYALFEMNVSDQNNSSFEIMGTGSMGKIYFVMETLNTNTSSLISELTPLDVEYSQNPSDVYHVAGTYPWLFLANTYSVLLTTNITSSIVPSFNGLSLIKPSELSELEISYRGISPQIYIILGLTFYVILAPLFAIVISYYNNKRYGKNIQRRRYEKWKKI